MDNYFQNIFPKVSGSQEDNQISIFGCPHSVFGRRGHKDTQILLPWQINLKKTTQTRVIRGLQIPDLFCDGLDLFLSLNSESTFCRFRIRCKRVFQENVYMNFMS